MTAATRHKHSELVKIIAVRLRKGQAFILGCSITSVGYWKHILSLHFPNARIEDHDEGLKVS